MTGSQGQAARFGLSTAILVSTFLFAALASPARAAPYAAMVMDARTGEVLYSRNADTRLHPASLTKMMTLYIAFEAVETGEIDVDRKVRISTNAASEVPSKLGLRAGSHIALRYLIRAAAVKSANDAATAIGEAIEGSEAAFVRRMNRTARALGMSNTTFKNAHGLTATGHLSTARDMTILGRHLIYDYPGYYNLFSRRTTHAGLRQVYNTNRRFLAAYRGADGIKTGFTSAAGYNLVGSARRGQERIVAAVFGGHSTPWRNAKMAELLDLGFERAPTRVALRKPRKPVYPPDGGGRIVRTQLAVLASGRPAARPAPAGETQTVAMQSRIDETLALVDLEARPVAAIEAGGDAPPAGFDGADVPDLPDTAARRPQARPSLILTTADMGAEPEADEAGQAGDTVVTRMSTAAGQWAISVGRYGSRYQAERVLLETALLELGTLDEALRRVVRQPGGFEANFVGLSREEADLACRRLSARDLDCATIGPG